MASPAPPGSLLADALITSLRVDVTPITNVMSEMMRRLDAQERLLTEQARELERHRDFEATSKQLFQQYKTALEQIAGRVQVTEKKTDIAPEVDKIRTGTFARYFSA